MADGGGRGKPLPYGGEKGLTNRDKLTALMNEARRRGITYGELSARLTQEETKRIYERYMGKRIEKKDT